ncbi:CCA tRNA nucleotidyltransferase [Oceanobacillus alkalisoli]|uniref:CCA tRNA nucleotidyltransferase n=1 Tax=Oceanobacillus alkalisoli TaxID=2925113 RepID=UPI001EE4502E|nr:CCA tRNA nucleotidyltransferase [Oceanobacillus alkalisoli]MCG5102901.1 CCA tRNA nucleotidyltransferase [Oceanobacillus alkalisoli]
MLKEIFKQAKPILETLEAEGHKAYFVGGCVRDLLLERPIKDIDITTSATPDMVQAIFPSVIPVGIEHGTVIVRHEKESYEVTTFRTEGSYSDSRRPDHVEFIHNIEKDLERRDFTINALAMDKTGRITDLFSGKSDLEQQIIRTVGNGKERFGEDALRIIRALRFSSQLGFQIEEETFTAMVACKSAIRDISVERITNEMERFFAGKHVSIGVNYLVKTAVHTVLPIFKDDPSLIGVIPHNMRPLLSFAEVIAFFHYQKPEIPIHEWTKEWKCSNRTKRLAIQLTEDIERYKRNGLNETVIYQLKEERFRAFTRLVDLLLHDKLSVTELRRLKQKLPIQSRDELAINGNDLLTLFPDKKPGVWVKHLLGEAEKAVITGKVNNQYRDVKEWLEWIQREID